MTIGERLKRLRLEKGLTQEELGRIVGVTKAAIQKYESGQIKNFKAESIRKLSDYFGMAPVYFIFDDVPEYSHKDITKLWERHFGSWFVAFLETMNSLNEDGKKKVYEYCMDIALIEKYKRK